jgi:HD superfamily phosphohydrolase YqeK
MNEIIADIAIPDTALVHEATAMVRAVADDTLFHHSRRVYLWGSLKARALGLAIDPELAYVGAMFHDLGLTDEYRSAERRFELDGADVARTFLRQHGRSEKEVHHVWLAIALHTTPSVPLELAPDVAVVTLGVETDVLGFELDLISPDRRDQVVAAHPRTDFKNRILAAFDNGMKNRPGSTFGTMNDDVLAHFDPTFRRTDFVELIMGNAWPE